MPSLLVLNAVSKNIVFTKEDDCFSAAEFFLTSTAEKTWKELATLILTYCISCDTGKWCVAWLPSVDRRWLIGQFSTTNSVRWTPVWSSGRGSAAPSSPAGSWSTVSSGAGIGGTTYIERNKETDAWDSGGGRGGGEEGGFCRYAEREKERRQLRI